jgi:hypothetical protein
VCTAKSFLDFSALRNLEKLEKSFLLNPVLRIRDVYPGYRIQGQKDSGSRIHIKEFKIILTLKTVYKVSEK